VDSQDIQAKASELAEQTADLVLEGASEVANIAREGAEDARRILFNKEPSDALTAFIGFIAAVCGTVFLLTLPGPGEVQQLGNIVYTTTLMLMFLTSASYHFFDIGEKGNRWLRRLDHVAVFLLIAGSYVPVLLHLLDGSWRIAMLLIVGALALLGTAFKLFWIDCPDWLSTSMYLALGWTILVPAYKIVPQMSLGLGAWLLGAGVTYSIGALIECFEWPNPKRLGYHSIWHFFVWGGATFHYIFVLRLMGDMPSF